MDRIALTKLRRPALQEIAKKEGVKANGKNAVIISLLIKKYPGGVPRCQTLSPLPDGRSGEKMSHTIKVELDEGGSSISTRGRSKRRRTESFHGCDSFEPLLSSTSITRPERELIGVIANASVVDPIPEPIVQGHSPPHPPGNKDVRFVQREMTHLINDGADLRADVDETEMLLTHAVSIVNNVSLDFRELSWLRRTIETNIIKELKNNRGLWDGMFMMPDEDDKNRWAEYLQELDDEEKQRQLVERQKAEMEAQERRQELDRSDSSDLSDHDFTQEVE